MIINKEIDYSYKKREIDYKNNLDKIGKEEENKYKKNLSNYSLYNEKKHTIYAKTFELIEIVKWLVIPAGGVVYSFNYRTASKKLLNHWLSKDIGIIDKEEIERLIELKSQSITDFEREVYHKEALKKWAEMRNGRQDLINYWRSNLLYFDKDISKAISIIDWFTQKMINNWHIYNDIEAGKVKTEIYQDMRKIYEKLHKKIDNLEEEMKKELWL